MTSAITSEQVKLEAIKVEPKVEPTTEIDPNQPADQYIEDGLNALQQLGNDATVNDQNADMEQPTSGHDQMEGTNQMAEYPYYIIVCDKEDGEGVEMPLESDGTLALSTLEIEYYGALGLKYRNPASGLMRVLTVDSQGRIKPPPEGWGETRFVACVPNQGVQKRPWMVEEVGETSTMESVSEPPFKKASFTPLTATAPLVPMETAPAPVQRPNPVVQRPRTYSRGPTPLASAPRPRFPHNNQSGPRRMPSKLFAFCDVCKVGMNSESQAQLHYVGKKHLDNVTKAGTPEPAFIGPRQPRGRTGMLPHPHPSQIPTPAAIAQPMAYGSWPQQQRYGASSQQDFSGDSYDYSGFSTWPPPPPPTQVSISSRQNA